MRGAWIEIYPRRRNDRRRKSLPVRGAWIEMAGDSGQNKHLQGRSPCGERGLKYGVLLFRARSPSSLPVRGAWIEIKSSAAHGGGSPGRSPCGERGLKSCRGGPAAGLVGGRSPCGERGLKLLYARDAGHEKGRSPCGERGLKYDAGGADGGGVPSLPVRGAWIEIVVHAQKSNEIVSLPVRGAWIEIRRSCRIRVFSSVAPRAGSVD